MSDYQKRTPERLVEILRSHGGNPRSWQQEAADEIERPREIEKQIKITDEHFVQLEALGHEIEAENIKLREQLVNVEEILKAARLWRESLEGDGWDKDAIETGICRPGILELMKAVDRLSLTDETR